MDADEARLLLRRVRVLADASDADLDFLFGASTWKPVKAGDEVVSHLAGGAQVYFIIEGAFRARLATAAGRPVAIRQLPAGAHFGEIAALTNTPRSLDVVAETDGLIVECTAEAFLDLMSRNAHFAKTIASYLALNVVLLTDRVFELAALEVRFRIYAELLRLAAHGEETIDGLLIRNAPTHEMIAASVGAQREAVTRELRMLASEGLLRQNKREILLLDLKRLRDLVQRRAGDTTSQAVDWRF